MSLKKIIKKHPVTYDSAKGNKFTFHKSYGTARIFRQSKKNLFYLDTSKGEEHEVLVTTVEYKK